MNKRIDIIGKIYGKLVVIKVYDTIKSGHLRYECQCRCGKTHLVLGTHLRRGKITHCGCDPYIGSKHHQWIGVGEISGNFWHNHVSRSADGSKGNRRIKQLTITIEQAWQMFLDQDRKCALSGIELCFPKKHKDKEWTASLDRIDSDKDYTIDNVQWVHKHINIMKNKFKQEYFLELCQLITSKKS